MQARSNNLSLEEINKKGKRNKNKRSGRRQGVQFKRIFLVFRNAELRVGREDKWYGGGRIGPTRLNFRLGQPEQDACFSLYTYSQCIRCRLCGLAYVVWARKSSRFDPNPVYQFQTTAVTHEQQP